MKLLKEGDIEEITAKNKKQTKKEAQFSTQDKIDRRDRPGSGTICHIPANHLSFPLILVASPSGGAFHGH